MTMGMATRTFPFGTQNGIDVDPTLRELLETEPVCRVRMADGAQAWLVTRHEDVRALTTHPRLSKQAATRPGVATITPSIMMISNLINMDPPDHTRVRKLLSSAFTTRRIEQLRPRAEEIVRAAGRDGGRWATGRVVPQLRLPAAYHRDGRAARHAVLGQRPLPELTDGDRLTDDELLAHTELFILAGQDTTANMISNSVITLFRHPDQLELLRQQPELIPNAVEELLRVVPTEIGNATRVATEDIQLRAVTIRAGDAVITIEQAANRDPQAFPDPDRFDITRRPKSSHLSFGHGAHFCLGASLARMQIAVALAGLLRRFPTLRLAVPDESLRWIPNQISYRVQELPVTW